MAELVNYYDEFGLNRDDTVSQIQSVLANIKLQLSSKVSRPSSQQEKWQKQLVWIDQATEVFKDDDSRDKYDIALRHEDAPTAAQEQAIDWTTRAWNYYFSGDNGAAFVAARKAKEQAPKDAMPFVVSSWVQLRDNEWRQAKQDADEAFVLDDQATDSVDVQMVRGTVYYFVGLNDGGGEKAGTDFERSLTSFDRGLVKATPAEQSELYWRRGLTLYAMHRFQDAFASAMSGITISVENTDMVQHGLEKLMSDCVNQLDNVSDPAKAAQLYQGHQQAVQAAAMLPTSKDAILSNISANIARCQKLDSLRKQLAQLGAVKDATGPQPGTPTLAIGVAVVAFIIMIAVFGSSAGAGLIFLLIFFALLAYVIWTFTKRSAWTSARNAYSSAQTQLQSVQQQLNATPIDAIWMKDQS